MRTIKFRGKRTDTGEMVFGDLIHGVGSKHGRMYILPVTNIYPKGCHELDGWEVVPDTVGQFTGLLDKDGKEIYERDILHTITFGFEPEEYTAIILYDNCRFQLSNGRNLFYFGQSDFTKMDDTIVIGNIYDNPELLKGGKE